MEDSSKLLVNTQCSLAPSMELLFGSPTQCHAYYRVISDGRCTANPNGLPKLVGVKRAIVFGCSPSFSGHSIARSYPYLLVDVTQPMVCAPSSGWVGGSVEQTPQCIGSANPPCPPVLNNVSLPKAPPRPSLSSPLLGLSPRRVSLGRCMVGSSLWLWQQCMVSFLIKDIERLGHPQHFCVLCADNAPTSLNAVGSRSDSVFCFLTPICIVFHARSFGSPVLLSGCNPVALGRRLCETRLIYQRFRRDLHLAHFNSVSLPKSLSQPVHGGKLFAALPVMHGVFPHQGFIPAPFEVMCI